MSNDKKMALFGSPHYWQLLMATITVLNISVPATHGQSYYLTISENQRTIFDGDTRIPHELHLNPASAASAHNQTETALSSLEFSEEVQDGGNTTIILIKNLRSEAPTELSQTAMDIITIVWYVATFLALAAFFLLMACSDRRCSEELRNGTSATEPPLPPPTPSPSYSEFAPPSYDAVMKLQQANKPNIYVIPLSTDESNKDDSTAGSATPPVTFYTINELHKLGT